MTDRLSPKDPEFWRVAFDEDQNSGYILSSDDLSTFDMRVSPTFWSIVTLFMDNVEF